MYIPPHNGPPSKDDVTRLLLATRAGDLVTVGDDGLTVSMIPFLYDPSRPQRGSLLGHLARPNGQWRAADGREALVAVHGTLRVHDDPEWTRDVVERLTRAHEGGRAEAWAVSDAPEPYIAGQLRAIVGIELEIDHVEAKWKLSQNRSAADVAGVIAGLDGGSDDDRALAEAMSKVEARRSDRGR